MSPNPAALSLADIAGRTENVPVGENFIVVRGITAEDGLAIFTRFPDLADLLGSFSLKKFIKIAPQAAAAVIAQATGSTEEIAARVPLETQLDILEAVGRLTFTKGFGPFAKRIMALTDAAGSENHGRASDMRSPKPSKPLSQADTPQA